MRAAFGCLTAVTHPSSQAQGTQARDSNAGRFQCASMASQSDRQRTGFKTPFAMNDVGRAMRSLIEASSLAGRVLRMNAACLTS